MTNEEKQLILKDLCARLPYGIKAKTKSISLDILIDTVITRNEKVYYTVLDNNSSPIFNASIDYVIPYLRSMSSMTKEERSELRQWGCLCMSPDDCVEDIGVYGAIHSIPVIDWLNAHHFDYRGLIEKGLALEAPEDMYKQYYKF